MEFFTIIIMIIMIMMKMMMPYNCIVLSTLQSVFTSITYNLEIPMQAVPICH